MKFTITTYFLLLLLTCCLNSFGQKESDKDDCFKKLGKSFISDGQDHQLIIQSKNYSRLNLIFLPKFIYELIICHTGTQTQLEMRLKDENGNIIYSNHNFHSWNFQFDAIQKGIVEFRLSGENANEAVVSLIVGYKAVDNNRK